MKTLFISTYSAHGDQIAINGMVNFLSLYYDKIYILVSWMFVPTIEYLYSEINNVYPMSYDYFMLDVNFPNDKFPNPEFLCLLGDEYIDQTCVNKIGKIVDDSAVTIKDIIYLKNISNNFIYSSKNPIGKKFGFNIPKIEKLDMVSDFYNKVGLPTEIKYKCFNFNRSSKDEDELIKKINPPDSYAIVCEYTKVPNKEFNVLDLSSKVSNFHDKNYINRKYIKSKFIINIHMLSEKYFDIIKLVENAEEVHLIENSFSMLIYFLQLSGRMKKIPINFHTYYRKEEQRRDNYKVYIKPKLDNWNLIYE